MPQVKIKNKPSSGVLSVTVHIDDIDVTDQSDAINLSSGNHKLHWWFAGPSGETLDITILTPRAGKPILEISDSIAPGYAVEAGDKAFAL